MKLVFTALAFILANLAQAQTQYGFSNLVASINYPLGLAVQTNGQIYVAQMTLASEIQGATVTPLPPAFNFAVCTAVDAASNLFVGDIETGLIKKITPQGVVTTFAGANGQFQQPTALAVDAAGFLYVAERGQRRIFSVAPDGGVSLVAGGGSSLSRDGIGSKAQFLSPNGITVAGGNNLIVIDGNCLRQIVPEDTNWVVTTISGHAIQAGLVDGIGAAARFNRPYHLTAGPDGSVFVADQFNHAIRKLTLAGTNWLVRTIAGGGGTGNTTGVGAEMRFFHPMGIAVDQDGFVYVSDNGNNRIVKGFPTELPLPTQFVAGWGMPRKVGGSYQMLLAGSAGDKVAVESSVGLTGWQTLQTNTVPASGLLELEINVPTDAGSAFYRTRNVAE